jgi:glycosyltransferase involved in cell wall biosynthesis
VVDLALAQQKLGAYVGLVCDHAPKAAEESVALRARTKGLESIFALSMPKHFRFSSVLRNVPKLNAFIKGFEPHVIHFHMQNAHLMGTFCATRLPILRVRSCYDPSGPKTDLRSRLLYNRHTDGLIIISKQAKIKATHTYNFNENKVLIAEPGVDLGRFSPDRKVNLSRKDLGLNENAFVIGMVTRIRESRRIDIALEATKILAKRFSQIQLFIVGRGRKGAVDAVVVEPSKVIGVHDRVILPGYCDGDRLVAAYQSMDILVYPMPGTDQTCRTVREALASGVPVIAPKIGFLKELLEDGENGYFIDLSAESLARALSNVIKNHKILEHMAQHAVTEANKRFSTHHQAEKVLAFYDRLFSQQHP